MQKEAREYRVEMYFGCTEFLFRPAHVEALIRKVPDKDYGKKKEDGEGGVGVK